MVSRKLPVIEEALLAATESDKVKVWIYATWLCRVFRVRYEVFAAWGFMYGVPGPKP